MPLKKITAAVLAALSLFFCACGAEKAEMRDSVSIWCSPELDALSDVLESMANEYNASLGRGGHLPVTVRRFEDVESFAAAFDSIHPDFMLCSFNKAAELSGRESLADISGYLPKSVSYSGSVTIQIPDAGHSFFPIGSEALMLLMNPSCFEDGAPDTLEELFAQAENFSTEQLVPFLSVDSYAHAFFSSMLQSDREFHAAEDKDLWNEEYRYIYNMFAEAAFCRALDLDAESGRSAVESGALPCAVVFSGDLAGISSAYGVSPMPEVEGAVKICWAETFGLAAVGCGGKRAESAAAFISWLNSEDRLSKAALSAGLVPASAKFSGWDSCPLSDALVDIYTGYSLYLPADSIDFMIGKDAFEEQIRSAFKVFG